MRSLFRCVECGAEVHRESAALFCWECVSRRSKESVRRARQQAALKYPLRSRASALVHRAVRKGELPSLKGGAVACVDCGNPAAHYDHRDYTKPLDVQPVCRACNIRRGRAHPYQDIPDGRRARRGQPIHWGYGRLLAMKANGETLRGE